MEQITNSVINNYSQYQTKPNSAPKQAAESEIDNQRLVLEITAGEENDSEGDRSQNTIQFNVQAPNNEFSAELSREQLVEGLDNRFTRQAVEGAIGTDNNGAPVAQAVALQSAEEDTVEAVVEGRQAQTTVDTYTNAVENDDSSRAAAPQSQEQTSEAINTYNQYQQQAIRQDIFFSRVDNSELDIKA